MYAVPGIPEENRQYEKRKQRKLKAIQKRADNGKNYKSRDFLVLWAHQINNKTPDRGFESSFAGEKQDVAACRQELFKIESYVEMALNYLRFEEMSNDLVLERNSLEQLVRQVVKNMQQFYLQSYFHSAGTFGLYSAHG